jgi:hypothetical protein
MINRLRCSYYPGTPMSDPARDGPERDHGLSHIFGTSNMKLFRRSIFAAAVFVLTSSLGRPALAGQFLSIPGAEDYVFSSSGILYISTSGGDIDRYDTQTNSFLTPFTVGGSLLGIDLSPDGKTLAVADTSRTGIDLVSTSTGAVTPVNFTPASGEGGAYTVAYESNGNLLVSTQFVGSGWVPLRQYDPTTGVTTVIGGGSGTNGEVRGGTMLSASADRNTIGLAEGNQEGGPIHAFSVASGSIVATTSLGSLFTYTIGANANGTQFAVPTYYGTYIYNLSGSVLTLQTTLGVNGNEPLYAVYSPNSHYLFAANWDFTGVNSGVLVYDTNTWQVVADLGSQNWGWDGNSAFGQGWMRVSPDGDWLAVSVNGGTELYNVSAFSAPVPEPSGFVLGLTAVVIGGLIFRVRKADVRSPRPE